MSKRWRDRQMALHCQVPTPTRGLKGRSSQRRRFEGIERAGHQVRETELAPIAQDVCGIDVAVVETQEWFGGAAWSEGGEGGGARHIALAGPTALRARPPDVPPTCSSRTNTACT